MPQSLIDFDEPTKGTRDPATADIHRMAILAELRGAAKHGLEVSSRRLQEITENWFSDVKQLQHEGHPIVLRQVGAGWLLTINHKENRK